MLLIYTPGYSDNVVTAISITKSSYLQLTSMQEFSYSWTKSLHDMCLKVPPLYSLAFIMFPAPVSVPLLGWVLINCAIRSYIHSLHNIRNHNFLHLVIERMVQSIKEKKLLSATEFSSIIIAYITLLVILSESHSSW